MSNDIFEVIEAIRPTIEAASKMAQRPEYSAEDIEQDIVVHLIERQGEFAGKQLGYVANRVRWFAKDVVGSNCDWGMDKVTVGEFSCSNDDDDEISIIEVTPDAGLSPEDQVIRNELYQAIYDGLEGTNRTIACMLAVGYDESEIAAKIGLSRSSVSQRKATIRNRLAYLL